MIAWLEFPDGVTDSPNNTRPFMAKNFRKLCGIVGIASVQIRCAHAACRHFDQQFVGPRVAEIKLLDSEGARALVHYGSGNFHG